MLSDASFRDLKILFWGIEIKFLENFSFFENYVTSEGAVSHNVLCYQQLPITRYQVRFYANYFLGRTTNSVFLPLSLSGIFFQVHYTNFAHAYL